ncbi:MAG: hypothetical protein ACETWB_02115 [Anaerolineae bacterium]
MDSTVAAVTVLILGDADTPLSGGCCGPALPIQEQVALLARELGTYFDHKQVRLIYEEWREAEKSQLDPELRKEIEAGRIPLPLVLFNGTPRLAGAMGMALPCVAYELTAFGVLPKKAEDQPDRP